MSSGAYLPDLTDPADLQDAKYELSRATSDGDLAAWARKYGLAAVEGLASQRERIGMLLGHQSAAGFETL